MAPKDPSTFVKVGKRKVDITSEDKEAGKRLKGWFSSTKAESSGSSTSHLASSMLDDLEKSDNNTNIGKRLFQGNHDIGNSKENLDSIFLDHEKQQNIPSSEKK